MPSPGFVANLSADFNIEGHLVVAACRGNRGIGLKNTLPWPRIPNDLKHLKNITMGKAILMGSNTYASIPAAIRPLPGRLTILLSSKTREQLACPDSVLIAGSLDAAAAILKSKGIRVVYVLGGAVVYDQVLKDPRWSSRVFFTEIDNQFDADCFFPVDLDQPDSGFNVISISADQVENGVTYRFKEYVRASQQSLTPFFRSNPAHEEYQYLDLVKHILRKGVAKGDRTGVGTRSVFGAQLRFNLRESFPLLTTKKVFWRGVAEELFWFIRGSTDGNALSEKGIKIWDANGSREFLDGRGFTDREVGDLGPVYGFQWRHFGAEYVDMHTDYSGKGVDQLANLIETIKQNPNDRRMLVCAWNPAATGKMALPPCHLLAQFYVANGELSCQMYQRSCDMGLGVPFNIASYSLLTYLIASITGLKPGDFVHVLGDAHVYNNHFEALEEQVKREPRPFPCLSITKRERIEDFCFEDLILEGYDPHRSISMKMAV